MGPRARAGAGGPQCRERKMSEMSGTADGEGPVLSSERAQKEGSSRCAIDARRRARGRNEKECNKLAVRLFSTCIKTSSGATDDLESIARHLPRPSIGPLFPPPAASSVPHYSATGRALRGPSRPAYGPVGPTSPKSYTLRLIERRCERARSNSLTGP